MVQGTEGYRFQNWASTYSCHPELYFEPTSVEEVRQILELAKQRSKRVKIVGCGHSPSDIACTDDYLIRLNKLNKLLQVDKKQQRVTVEAGMLLSHLNEELASLGLALSNIGAVSDLTVGGVIGTGTHNTGIQHGILATQVLNDLDTHLKQSEYFRFFWFPHTDKVTVFYADRTDKPVKASSSWLWDYAIGYYLLELLLWISAFFPRLVPWITQLFFWLIYSVKGEQVNRSDKAFNFECLFKQHVSDWAVPIEQTGKALGQLKEWLERNPDVRAHFPVEVRFARGDEILLSPCYKQNSCFMNIIMYRPYGKELPRERYWAAYEQIMKRNGGRPHWAKAHSCVRQDFEKMYPAFHKFCSIREQLDPSGMFLNNYLEKAFF
ncbi:L-gulonolactone oxidase-like isoform X2 [Heptranchias perlo]|uniref:L-gulonolactone oxidase-like isoform X2 n=1 Tax=Heptranchias perlo TaxID=212740 RepID=UPI00355ABF76